MPKLSLFLHLAVLYFGLFTQITQAHKMGKLRTIDVSDKQYSLPLVSLDSSNLPLLLINTRKQKIVDEPDIIAQIKVIDNAKGFNRPTDAPTYQGNIAIEVRGFSSQSFSKKSYGFTTLDAQNNRIDTTFFGFLPEKDWILHASYADKTLMHNVLSMHLAQQMGHYASQTRYCELIINGKYKGVYVLMEQIKRSKSRVNIAKLKPTDTQGEALTGGYIFKIDHGEDGGWNSDFGIISAPTTPLRLQFVYPKYRKISLEQAQYLQAYVDSFEHALASPTYENNAGHRYDEYIDVASFVDYFIISELSRNLDAYRISTYFTKDKNQKIKASPVWDYDLAWRNGNFCDAVNSKGWMYYEFCGHGNPFWWDRLLADTVFTQTLYCRWQQLRANVLHPNNIYQFIDQNANFLATAQQRNFTKYPVWGKYVWPNPKPLANNYAQEISYFKQWIAMRFAWIDEHISTINNLYWQSTTNLANRQSNLLDPDSTTQTVQLLDMQGKLVWQDTNKTNNLPIAIDMLPNGLYCVQIITANRVWQTKWIKY